MMPILKKTAMEDESGLESSKKVVKQKRGKTVGTMLPNVEPFVPRDEHNPRELRSWAKRTGFVSDYSAEAGTSASEKNSSAVFNLNKGRGERNDMSSSRIEIDPTMVGTRNARGSEIEPVARSNRGDMKNEHEEMLGMRGENPRRRNANGPVSVEGDIGRNAGLNGSGNGDVTAIGNANVQVNRHGNGHGGAAVAPVLEQKEEDRFSEEALKIDMFTAGDPADAGWQDARLKCGLRENPGFAPLIYYGLQHYLSLVGSLIFIPLIMVPAMGGTDKDTATVISTVLFLSGITTILHSYFGTRLPLVQGSSFVYLAPALVIMNAQEFRNLTDHKFRNIMRELQGAVIVGSLLQSILGFSGLMSFFLRLINPVVVAPTIAAVGLAFFSFGFPQAGSCVEISIPQIALILIFTLYLRGISMFGRHVFRIYAVPLSVVIIWAYAFFLTTGGAYNYKGCSPDIPSSNILSDACRKHAYTMQHCRTDVSNAWSTSSWVIFPHPLQWGIPIFHFRTSIVMIFVSLITSVDSVATYYSASLRVNLQPPSPGVVSRGIALEGFCSLLAGLWGSGTGATTLTENVHTINITEVANRKAVVLGAAFLILISFLGKLGAVLASIPQALAASVLCFIWSLIVALGISNLQYAKSASFRNITIVGISLFLGLSIPAYFQQYQPEISLILPSYLVPYAAASSGPFHTGSNQLDFAINALMSMNMVVTFFVAFLLDNTVPGSREERGVYVWSRPEDLASDPSLQAEYSLPRKVARCFCWAKCLGV